MKIILVLSFLLLFAEVNSNFTAANHLGTRGPSGLCFHWWAVSICPLLPVFWVLASLKDALTSFDIKAFSSHLYELKSAVEKIFPDILASKRYRWMIYPFATDFAKVGVILKEVIYGRQGNKSSVRMGTKISKKIIKKIPGWLIRYK